VKERILAERFGSFAPYVSEYSLTNTVQRNVETRCADRSGSNPPYYFEATDYGRYRLTEEGHARLSLFKAAEELKRAEEEKTRQAAEGKRREAEQRSFLTGRTEPPNRPELVEFNGRRYVRDYPIGNKLKDVYGHSCQVCSSTVATLDCAHYDNCGYVEVHHIRPLGSGHDGPDYPGYMLVLCPDHHAAFDLWTMGLNPETLEAHYLEPDGELHKKPLSSHEVDHHLDRDCFKYAWELCLQKWDENGVDITGAES
jgi:hypothetical protein